MPITEHVYNGKDNTFDLVLEEDVGTGAQAVSLTSVTRMVVYDVAGGWKIDYAETPAYFSWDQERTGLVKCKFGHAGVDAGKYRCRLIVYDPTNTLGVVWCELILIFHAEPAVDPVIPPPGTFGSATFG